MNRKGFISTAVVYAFFLLFLILCLSLLSTYNHYRKTLTVEKNDMKTSLKLNSNILYKQVLLDNGGTTSIVAKGKPDFASASTSNEGMYSAPDDYGTSYYFRGAVDNNWVYFAGIYWRIIRINGDKSVRMIYSGTMVPTESEAVLKIGTDTQIYDSYSLFNSHGEDAVYVGYMYTKGEIHGYSNDSDIKKSVDDWFYTNLISYSSFISDEIFCVDRSTYSGMIAGKSRYGTGIGTAETWFSTSRRLISTDSFKSVGTGPIFKCSTQSDAFTAKDTIKGNAYLKYPIGLITADEVSMAGGLWGDGTNLDSVNESYYLYTGTNYWAISPDSFYYDTSWVYYVSSYGFFRGGNLALINNNYSPITGGIRPVISLNSDVIATGKGTWDNPYVVEE